MVVKSSIGISGYNVEIHFSVILNTIKGMNGCQERRLQNLEDEIANFQGCWVAYRAQSSVGIGEGALKKTSPLREYFRRFSIRGDQFKCPGSNLCLEYLQFAQFLIHQSYLGLPNAACQLPRTINYPALFKCETFTGKPPAGPALENITLYAGSPMTSRAFSGYTVLKLNLRIVRASVIRISIIDNS